MDPINGLSQITQILRQKLSEHTKTQKKSGSSGSHASTSDKRAEKPSIQEIERKIAERIKALSDEELRGKKGSQIFVETVIAWEFGEQLLADPDFADFASDVVKTLHEHPDVKDKLGKMLTSLQRG
ncbi:hypothetical protein KQ940_16680 [Marinobacterium sp. D7]|uniref:hypothetical protein n=1 Tax=Marinobacterium ramblicola TaxID=2849041 RepID=UPI001C2DB4BC|nr:hypothetical protein [Marinobacterium ramblicola]MBV1789692.1 hypothetical protein [Marinobacterium ramblicola]